VTAWIVREYPVLSRPHHITLWDESQESVSFASYNLRTSVPRNKRGGWLVVKL